MRKSLWSVSYVAVCLALFITPLWGQDITPTATQIPTAESTAHSEPSIPVSPAPAVTIPETETLTPALETTADITDDPTGILPTAVTITATIPLLVSATVFPTSSAIVLREASGYVYYQNSQSQHGAIEIEIFTDSRQLIGSSMTDALGVYHVAVPQDMPFWLVADAPLHRENAVRILPGEALPVLVLAGGDLNDDECVTLDDLALLEQHNTAADVNSDNHVDIADIAILTGNLRVDCEIFARVLPPTPIIIITPEIMPTLPATATGTLTLPTLTETPLPAAATPLIVLTTAAPSFTPTLTLTAAENMPMQTILPEATPEAEITPEVHGG